MSAKRILIIKHGALGDIILATAGFKAIREAYPDAHITCLTSKPFAPLLSACPWFDEVVIDEKPRLLQLQKIRRLQRFLNHPFDFIFDLQTSTRTSYYWHLLKTPKPNFSGVQPRASHAYTDKARHHRHAHDNLQHQLAIAGIHSVGLPDISWLDETITLPPTPFTLIVPGGAAHRPAKRWPAAHYVQLAANLTHPVLIGTNAERDVLNEIASAVPHAINLCGETSIAQLATIARSAQFVVGNDTGPMHVIAAAGCKSLVLFSADSSPERSAPVGDHVRTLQKEHLIDLSVEEVQSMML